MGCFNLYIHIKQLYGKSHWLASTLGSLPLSRVTDSGLMMIEQNLYPEYRKTNKPRTHFNQKSEVQAVSNKAGPAAINGEARIKENSKFCEI